jgi:hypothetical protein
MAASRDTLDDVSAAGLLREAALLVVTVSIAVHAISALVRLIDETESVEQQRAYRRRRRPREAHEPSDGLPEIHRGERSATLRGRSLPMARDAQRPRAQDGVGRASMPPVCTSGRDNSQHKARQTSSKDKADYSALPRACRPELAPVTESSMNCPCDPINPHHLRNPAAASGRCSPPSDSEPKPPPFIPAAQRRFRLKKVSSGSLFYSRVVEQQVRASKSEWSSSARSLPVCGTA